MPDRIPLQPGIDAPEFVAQMISVFGNNPHGEPMFRLVRSERKMIFFAGEIVPEYAYLPYQGWVLETWTPPEKDAGTPASWGAMQEALMGPYPQYGTYNFVKQYPQDWTPSEETVRLVCKGIEESRQFSLKMRAQAIRERLQAEEVEQMKLNAEMIVDSFDSAALGKIQTGAGGKNNFRTPEDWERDRDRAISRGELSLPLPAKGGAIYTPSEA